MLNFVFTKTPLVFFVQSLWRDEAYSYLLAKKSIIEILVLSTKDFSPPLYHILLHYWIILFGSSEIALRSLSLVFYWLTIYVIYNILTEILKINSKKSFIYLILFIINPLFLYYAFEARMYSMFAFFATLSFYSYYLKKNRLYLISSILGLFTHYFMIFIILGQIVFYFIYEKRNQINKKIILSSIFSIISFTPWIILKFINGNPFEQSFWIPPINFNYLINFFSSIYFGYENDMYHFQTGIAYLSLAIFIFIIFGYLHFKKTNKNNMILVNYLLIWSIWIPLFVLLISIIKPIFLPRYLIFTTIGLVLLLVTFINQLQHKTQLFFLLIVSVITIIINQQQIKYKQKADLRKTIREIKFIAKPNDLLYVTNPLNFHIAEYYLDTNRVYIFGKNYQEIPVFIGKNLIPENKMTNLLPKFPIKAFILTGNNSYVIQSGN